MNDKGRLDGHMQPAHTSPNDKVAPHAEEESFDATEALLRLLIGALGVGADELRARLRQWDSGARADAPQSALSDPRQSATISESLRRTAIGMLFEGQKRARRRFSQMAVNLARASLGAEYLFTTAVEPAIRRSPLNGMLGRLDELSFMALLTLDRWSARGWTEERQGRAMARGAAARLTDEIFDYVARNPRVRELIEQQSASMAEETLDEARERMATADTRIEQLAHRLLHRPARDMAAHSNGAKETSPLAETGS